jgi:hypothetical protein
MFRAATSGIDTTPHVSRVLGLDEDEEDDHDEDPAEAIKRREEEDKIRLELVEDRAQERREQLI